MTDLSLEPLNRPSSPTATELAFLTLLEAIVSLRLPPGSKVAESDVARQLDMSRQPVRDAFFRLSKLGLIVIRPQRATLVAKISLQAVMDAVFIRTAVEVECLRLAGTGIKPAQIAQLKGIIEDQRAVCGVEDPAEFHRQDENFHAAICEMAGQQGAWGLIQEHKAHIDRARYLTLSTSRRRVVLREHEAVVDGLSAGDLARAETCLRAHLGDILNVLPQLREAHAAYFGGEG